MKRFLLKTSLWILLLPIALTFVGAASNQAVLIANHDKFPVMVNDAKAAEMLQNKEESAGAQHFVYDSHIPDGMLDDVHEIMTPQTHLNALADIFDLHEAIYSVGDLLLELGGWLGIFAPYVWFFEAVRKLNAGM